MKNVDRRDYTVPFFERAKRTLKVATLVMVGSLSTMPSSVYAQTARLSVEKHNCTIGEVMKEIEKEGDVTFFFNDNQVDVNKQVSVSTKDASLEEVLDQLFKGTNYHYSIVNNQVLVKSGKTSTAKVAQTKEKQITGVVVDDSGEPIIGANILEAGTTNGTITDLDGNFTLTVGSNSVLTVSYIGYVSQEVKTTNKTKFTITLREDAKSLEEIVVVGYGVQKKKDLTGAVASVKGSDLASRKTTQLATALQGAISGVNVTRGSSAPGAGASIRVRGITTIGDSNPLVIIDGIPGNLNDVNANDVESMSVLKDAASSSIYGSRAAAGVIVITTKRAKEKDLKINYSFEYGLELMENYEDNVAPDRYMAVHNELKYNDNHAGGHYQVYPQEWVDNWYDLNKQNPDKYPITDWRKEIFENNAPKQSHVISLVGGSKNVKTNASFAYDKTEGIIYNNSYERFMIRVNNDLTFNKFISATLDFNFKRSKTIKPAAQDTEVETAAWFTPSIFAARWSDGRYANGRGNGSALQVLHEAGDNKKWNNTVGVRASLNITPIEGLKLSAIISPTYNSLKQKVFRKAVPYTTLEDPNTIAGYTGIYSTTNLNEYRNDDYNVTTQFIGNYMKSFGKHDINVMAGYENYYAFFENLSASRDQYELSTYPYLDLGSSTTMNNKGNAQEVAYRSWLGRAMYSFDDKYLLQANIRYDGSSRFHKDYRWGAFPSFSAGWVISQENFMKNVNTDILSFLKLRASWGTLGNERIGSYYPYQAAMSFSNILFYQNGKLLSSLSAAQQYYAIKNISWEKTESFDIGIDANFFKNRLHFTFDYYKKKTKDMLLALEIPDYVGFDNPQKNTGDMSTHGYDIDLSWNDRINDFTYSVAFNFSDYVSKMGDLGGTQFLGAKVKLEGSEFNEWYGYVSEGLFLSQEELDNSPKINKNAKVGDVKYKDISGPDGVPDGKISPEYDRVLLGGSLPRYLFGGNINLGYKGLDFSMAFQGVGKQKVAYPRELVQPIYAEWGSISKNLDGKFWSENNTPEQNAKAWIPRLSTVNGNANYTMSDHWLFNGRFLRIKNITLGYTLPSKWSEKVFMKNARVYVSANDMFTFSKYPKGWAPEMPSIGYPMTKSFVFGLSVGF